jgi:hypothetical protein
VEPPPELLLEPVLPEELDPGAVEPLEPATLLPLPPPRDDDDDALPEREAPDRWPPELLRVEELERVLPETVWEQPASNSRIHGRPR